MSRFDQPADDRELDDYDPGLVRRTCSRVGCDRLLLRCLDDPYELAPLCDLCQGEAERRAALAQERQQHGRGRSPRPPTPQAPVSLAGPEERETRLAATGETRGRLHNA